MSLLRASILVFLLLSLGVSASASADERVVAFDETAATAVFEEAMSNWDRGMDAADAGEPGVAREQFRLAAARLQQLVDQGFAGPDVWFNLGLVSEKIGDSARAVHCLRMAQERAPLDAEIAETLAWVRGVGTENSLRSIGPSPLRLLRGWIVELIPISLTGLLGCGAVLFWFGRALVRRGFERTGATSGAVGVALGVVAIAGLAVNVMSSRHELSAVVIGEDVSFHRSIGQDAPKAMAAMPRPGDEYRVEESRGDWLRVALDESMAWVHRDDVLIVTLSSNE